MLTIGLVNNMAPAALQSTERQFCDILHEAGADIPFRIRWFRLFPVKPVSYEPIENLWRSPVDGLIVTGAEPRTASLRDEPIWPALTRTVDWAAEHTSSTIFSCLAAHAAVLHLAGIERRPSKKKIFGVFESVKVADHPFLQGVPAQWRFPHSRWNDLPEDELTKHGYTVLAKSSEAGIDLFLKPIKSSLFVFIQTHPEYFPDTLLREFRRDIARFNNAQQEHYPAAPRSYFGTEQTALLEAIHTKTISNSRDAEEAVLGQAEIPESWRPSAVHLYRNWLLHLQANADAGLAH